MYDLINILQFDALIIICRLKNKWLYLWNLGQTEGEGDLMAFE